jgi:hypothetical protein
MWRSYPHGVTITILKESLDCIADSLSLIIPLPYRYFVGMCGDGANDCVDCIAVLLSQSLCPIGTLWGCAGMELMTVEPLRWHMPGFHSLRRRLLSRRHLPRSSQILNVSQHSSGKCMLRTASRC